MDNERLIDETLEAMLRAVMPEVEDKIVDDYLNGIEIYENHEFSDRHNKYMQKFFRNERRKEIYKKLYTYSKRAAVILIVIFLVSAVSVISVSAWRIRFLNLIIEMKDISSNIWISENITKNSFISDDISLEYIPEGFGLEQSEVSDSFISLKFIKDDENFRFTKDIVSYKNVIDTENANTKNILIKGKDAFNSENENVNILVWYDDNYVYMITGNIPFVEMVLIAEKIK